MEGAKAYARLHYRARTLSIRQRVILEEEKDMNVGRGCKMCQTAHSQGAALTPDADADDAKLR